MSDPRQQDVEALERLYAKYHRDLIGIARVVLDDARRSEEVALDALLGAWCAWRSSGQSITRNVVLRELGRRAAALLGERPPRDGWAAASFGTDAGSAGWAALQSGSGRSSLWRTLRG